MKCPKCNHYPTFKEVLGDCDICGRSDWTLGNAHSGGKMILCPHCEKGENEVSCSKCEATITGKWLEVEKKSGCIASFAKLMLLGIIITIVLMVLASMSK